MDLVHEFFQGFVNHALATLHVDNLKGSNAHHQAETAFKAFGRALRMAVELDPRMHGHSPLYQGQPVGSRHTVSSAHPEDSRMIDIAVVDYGMGNLRSVSKAVEHVAPGLSVVVTSRPDEVRSARRVVFPGQGAMPDCMRELDARGLRPAVLEAARSKPFLGICIGLQMLFEVSEEGNVPGLDLVEGRVVRFPRTAWSGRPANRLKVPHMGWNEVQQTLEHPLWRGIAQGAGSTSCTATIRCRAAAL